MCFASALLVYICAGRSRRRLLLLVKSQKCVGHVNFFFFSSLLPLDFSLFNTDRLKRMNIVFCTTE